MSKGAQVKGTGRDDGDLIVHIPLDVPSNERRQARAALDLRVSTDRFPGLAGAHTSVTAVIALRAGAKVDSSC